MRWVTWNQAIISALVSAVIALVLSKAPSTPKRDFLFALSKEFALIAVLYTLYARACDPVVEFLKMSELHSNEEIVDMVMSTCFDGLASR